MAGYIVELYHVLWILRWVNQQESMGIERSIEVYMLTKKADMLSIVCTGSECCCTLESLPT